MPPQATILCEKPPFLNKSANIHSMVNQTAKSTASSTYTVTSKPLNVTLL